MEMARDGLLNGSGSLQLVSTIQKDNFKFN